MFADIKAAGQAIQRHRRNPRNKDAIYNAFPGGSFDAFVKFMDKAIAADRCFEVVQTEDN